MTADKKPEDGGPAFPIDAGLGHMNGASEGMTLRDHFAEKAMAGLLGMRTGEQLRKTFGDKDSGPSPADLLAVHAYAIADAMIQARKS